MSAITLGHQVKAASSTDGTSFLTGTLTPTATGTYVLIFVTHAAASAPADITSIAGTGGTPCINPATRIASQGQGLIKTEVWQTTTTASASTITITMPGTNTACVWDVQEYTNVDTARGYVNLIGGITANVIAGAGTSATPPLTFRNPQHSSNMFVAVYGHADASAVTPKAGWTESSDIPTTVPNLGQEVQYLAGGTDINATATLAGSVDYAAIGVELWGLDGRGLWSAIETFTKADGAFWDADQPWDTPIGSPTTISNRGGSAGTNIYANDILSNDCSTGVSNEARVNAAVMTLNGSSVIGVRLRCHTSTAESYEFIRVGASTLGAFSVILRYRDNGGIYTNLAGPTTIPRASLTTAEQLFMTVVGNTLTAYLDGAQVLAVSDTRLATSRNRGGLVIRGGATNDTLADDFRFGDLGKTSTGVSFAATIDMGRNAAKAQHTEAKMLRGKSATANQAFSILSNRFAALKARIPTVSYARASGFAVDFEEGFRILRALGGKNATASKAKGSITTQQRGYSTKVPFTFGSGGIFAPSSLKVSKGYTTQLPTADNATGPSLLRLETNTARLFQSDNATASLSGAHIFFETTVPTASGLLVTDFAGRAVYTVAISIVSNATATLIYAPFTYYFACPANADEDPPVLPDWHIGNRLMRHYKSRPVGRNVYLWSDGTVTEFDPDGYTSMWKESDRTSATLPNAPHVVHVFWGGHDGTIITPAEKAILEAAGYVTQIHP